MCLIGNQHDVSQLQTLNGKDDITFISVVQLKLLTVLKMCFTV